MNRLEHAVGISSEDSPNNQCKDRHRLLIAARKRNASERSARSLARRSSFYAPVHVRLLGAQTVMFQPENAANVVKQFRFVYCGADD